MRKILYLDKYTWAV